MNILVVHAIIEEVNYIAYGKLTNPICRKIIERNSNILPSLPSQTLAETHDNGKIAKDPANAVNTPKF